MILRISMPKILFLFIFCIFAQSHFAQITPAQLKSYLLNTNKTSNLDTKLTNQVKEFYQNRNYNLVWLQNSQIRNQLIHLLQSSPKKGFQAINYQFNFIESFTNRTIKLGDEEDSILAEIKFTDAALHYYTDIVFGNLYPVLQYNGINYQPKCVSIIKLLDNNIAKGNLEYHNNAYENTIPEIALVENKIENYLALLNSKNFKEVVVSSKNISIQNKALLQKLYQLGITDTLIEKSSPKILEAKVKEAQQLFNLLSDGVIRSTLLNELNVPISVRLQQLSIAVNYYRWLQCYSHQQSVVVVNIPAANLKVYQAAKAILEMKVIVGKKSTPTPTLSSTITEVVLYPYWNVPYSIATKELLPSIKANPRFIDDGNYQVLDKNGNIIKPYAVNWHALSRNYFPYTIRQSTGCDNALGLLKLNFYNPFGVYLHDTPNKMLFGMNKRYFSHGCMRMENPMTIGHLLLKDNLIAIDTVEQKKCLLNQAPIIVPVTEKLPVLVWYNIVSVNTAGKLVFYEDVYEKFKGLN
jgi:murein L,D-transpeptidase YcbB/YkuD